MVFWKQYLLTIIVCSLSCSIITQMISDVKRKQLMKFLCGTVFAITILKPLTSVNLEETLQFYDIDWESADAYIAEGEIFSASAQEKCIKDTCETYILDRAKALGAEITVAISLDDMFVPVWAEIRCEPNWEVQKKLQEILETDLGIPKENQEWILNQENNSS